MKKWLFFSQRKPNSTVSLFTSISIASGLQISGIIISYSSQILLARWLGVTEYGIYDYIINLSLFLALISGLGLPNSLLKFIPEYEIKKDWERLQGVIWGSWLLVAIASTLVSIAATAVIVYYKEKFSFSLSAMLLGVWTIPLLALVRQQMEMARAIKEFILAYLPSLILLPIMLVVGLFYLHEYIPELTSNTAIAVTIFCLICLLGVQLWLCCQKLPKQLFTTQPIYAPKRWLSVSVPFLLGDGAYLILNKADIFMTGIFLDAKYVGIYSAALKTAGWINILLTASSTVLAPTFTSLYARGNRRDLQKLLTTVAGWIFFPSLVASFLLIIFGDSVLGLFGSEFQEAKWATIVLIIGQIVNVGAGCVGYIMQVTGHNYQCVYVYCCCTAINLVLCAILIPLLGIMGGAIATSATMILWNVWLHHLVVKNIGVRPSILALIQS
jgi:O-antigen/teichoic acid export membrane protein